MTKKEVAKKEEALPSVASTANSFTSGLDAEDIIIPKVLLMQSISDLVEAEKAKSGDFVHSLDEVVLGQKDTKPVEFIALGMFKNIVISKNKKYAETIAHTPENAKLPYNETVDGVEVNRATVMNYYVLRPQDIEDMTVFPMVISFKRTSLKGGKKLATKLMMLEEFGAQTYAKTFKLIAKQEESEHGKYYVMDITDGRKSNEIETKQAKKWWEKLQTLNVRIHEEEISETKPEGLEAIPF